jgi:hypothetical protein
MRITPLVLFILCIALSSSIIGTLGMFNVIPSDANTIKLMNTISESTNQTYFGSTIAAGTFLSQVGDFVTGLWIFIKIFFISILIPSAMLQNFGVPANIALWFSFPIYFVYIIAIIQMISGRYLE